MQGGGGSLGEAPLHWRAFVPIPKSLGPLQIKHRRSPPTPPETYRGISPIRKRPPPQDPRDRHTVGS
jgi:hypothetical protein